MVADVPIMLGRLLFTKGLRVGTLLTVLGAPLFPSDLAAQLPQAGSDAREAALGVDDMTGRIDRRPFDPRMLSTNEMTSLSSQYSYEVEIAVAQVQTLRKRALAASDGIKVSCIDQVLPELRMLGDTLAARFNSIGRRSDEFLTRADFLVIWPGWKRVRELRQEAEACVGEELDSSAVNANSTEVPPSNIAETASDPPQRPVMTDRPSEASVYR